MDDRRRALIKSKEEECYLNSHQKKGDQNCGYRPKGVPQFPLKAGCPKKGRGGGTPTR